MKKIKVLSIGNSFSQDAQRYLYGVARAGGVDMKTVNLYIGGCSLERHYRNMLSEEKAYDFEINGISGTGVKISLKDALLSDEWDFITVQQQSLRSCNYETFVPYIEALVEYVRKFSPKAKIYVMRTWGYKEGSQKLLVQAGYPTNKAMLEDIKIAYEKAAKDIKADGIVPLGDAVAMATELQAEHIHRDEFHMSKGFGRYLLGLVMFEKLTGRPTDDNPFRDFDEELSDDEIKMAKAIAKAVREK